MTGAGRLDIPAGLPEPAREAAYRAYRCWRIGDDGDGRLHAALVAAAPLIRAAERARIIALSRQFQATFPIDIGEGCTDYEAFAAVLERGDEPDCEARANVAEAKLDEIRRIIAAFLAHHGNSAAFALQSARDLGEGIRHVLDRTALGAGEEP